LVNIVGKNGQRRFLTNVQNLICRHKKKKMSTPKVSLRGAVRKAPSAPVRKNGNAVSGVNGKFAIGKLQPVHHQAASILDIIGTTPRGGSHPPFLDRPVQTERLRAVFAELPPNRQIERFARQAKHHAVILARARATELLVASDDHEKITPHPLIAAMAV